MNWDKRIYPKDVWKWICDHLPYWPWDITGGLWYYIKKVLALTYIFGSSDESIFKRYLKAAKANSGGYTPREEVSIIRERGWANPETHPEVFDTGQWDIHSEPFNRLDDEDKWAMRNYDLAERTGLWDVNMSDGPVIDATPLDKFDFKREIEELDSIEFNFEREDK